MLKILIQSQGTSQSAINAHVAEHNHWREFCLQNFHHQRDDLRIGFQFCGSEYLRPGLDGHPRIHQVLRVGMHHWPGVAELSDALCAKPAGVDAGGLGAEVGPHPQQAPAALVHRL